MKKRERIKNKILLALLAAILLSFASCLPEEAKTSGVEGETVVATSTASENTAEASVNATELRLARSLQSDLLNEKIKDLDALFQSDLNAGEQALTVLLKNATDSEQKLVQQFGEKTMEQARLLENPAFYHDDLAMALAPYFSNISWKSSGNDGAVLEGADRLMIAVTVKNCMLEAHSEWWTDEARRPHTASGIKRIREIEEKISSDYKNAWALLFREKKPVDALNQMMVLKEQCNDYLIRYEATFGKDTNQSFSSASFLTEACRQFGEQTKTADFWQNLQSGDWIPFGSFEQDNISENGAEPLLWRVSMGHNNSLYLDCYPVLKYMQWTSGDYEKDPTLLYWENCQIRTWLNGEFYESAFTAEEKKWISAALLENDWNYTSEDRSRGMGGADTTDRVFLLSEREGLTSRAHLATDYAKANGAPSDVYGQNDVWRRDTSYKTYAGFWNGFRGVSPCIQIKIPAA